MIKSRYIQPDIYKQKYTNRDIQKEVYKKRSWIKSDSFKVLVN